MDTKSHRINLPQKRKAENGLRRFYPVQWDGNKPDPSSHHHRRGTSLLKGVAVGIGAQGYCHHEQIPLLPCWRRLQGKSGGIAVSKTSRGDESHLRLRRRLGPATMARSCQATTSSSAAVVRHMTPLDHFPQALQNRTKLQRIILPNRANVTSRMT
jgi:hypothetical protein